MSDTTATGASSGTKQFLASNGQIRDPNGNVFTARGIALNDGQLGAANQVLADFPGLNFVRLSVYNYQSPDAYSAFIQTMTSRGIVVELEDHTSSNGANAGGGQGGAFTGDQLSNELNWYSSVAGAYASNPYVWFGTDNEPPADGLSQWQQQTYNAIRDTGNTNPIMIELPGGGWPNENVNGYGMDPNVYASMSNIAVDVHFYGWSSNGSTDQQTVNNALSDLVRGAQTVPSAEGTVPVIVGETGQATDGWDADSNAWQVMRAAQQSGQTSGAVAWTWHDGAGNNLTDGNGNLTSYGQNVANWITSGAPPSAPPAQASGADMTPSGPAATSSDGGTVSQADTGTAANTASMTFINDWGTTTDLSGGSSTVTDNAGGTTFILPAAGNGIVTFANDILNLGDTLDLSKALGATDWDGSPDTLGNYLSVSGSDEGAVVSIAGTAGGATLPIATIAGEAGLDLGTLLGHATT